MASATSQLLERDLRSRRQDNGRRARMKCDRAKSLREIYAALRKIHLIHRSNSNTGLAIRFNIVPYHVYCKAEYLCLTTAVTMPPDGEVRSGPRTLIQVSNLYVFCWLGRCVIKPFVPS